MNASQSCQPLSQACVIGYFVKISSTRPPVLKAYLDHFAGEVQRFFPVPKGSPVEAFIDLAPRCPVFALDAQNDSVSSPIG
jgi:hypothetical protein